MTNALPEPSTTALQQQIRRLSIYVVVAGATIIALLAVLVWQLHGTAPHPVASLTIFERAIDDAAHPQTPDVSHQLQAITPANPGLIWSDDKRWLKVVSWMSDKVFNARYAELVGDPAGARTPPGQPVIWVTVAPEMQNFCRGLHLDDPSFRLKQRLGLDPNRRYERFVELWVQPEDLFRPCPDPEIDDNQCELDFPDGAVPAVKHIADYRGYFEGLRATLYRPGGAPWTRLGYTYDWAYGRRGFGASEFVVVPDAPYRVQDAYTTAEYCSG